MGFRIHSFCFWYLIIVNKIILIWRFKVNHFEAPVNNFVSVLLWLLSLFLKVDKWSTSSVESVKWSLLDCGGSSSSPGGGMFMFCP